MNTNKVLQTLLLSTVMMLFPVVLMANGTFFLDENGVTIRCPGAEPGETGLVDGIEYEAVDRDLLIQRRDEEADLSRVCTTPVTDMSGIFAGDWSNPNTFNQNIGGWDVSNVTNMANMFNYASAFNQDIGNWDVSNVTNMAGMFEWASAFDQDVSGWYVSNVSSMRGMFYYASAFNQDIGRWDVSNVNNMSSMFSTASSFNQDIGGWEVGNVTNMSWMFNGASSFSQDIGGWDVGNVTNMRYMFTRASSFNQDISGWDVGNVTNMEFMFQGAVSFNQDISGWDVGNVTSIRGMFSGASSFDQDIGSWDLGNLWYGWASEMLDYSGLSIENYDATLIGWNNGRVAGSWINLPEIGAGGLTYHAGEAARAELIDAGWSFSGDERASGYLRLTGSEGFRMLSSPVPVDYATLLEPFWTQGVAGSNNPDGDVNVWTWGFSGEGEGWAPLADMQDAVAPGSGVLVYVFADDDPGDPDSPHGFPKVITLEGDEHADGVAADVNPQADGWTLLGNPFDASIRFGDLDRDNLTDVIYVWDVNEGANGGNGGNGDPGAGSWKSWSVDAGAGDITDGILSGFQGFLVQNTSAGGGEVTFPHSARTIGGSFYGKQMLAGEGEHGSAGSGGYGSSVTSDKADVIRLELTGQGMRSSSWLSFREHGSLDELPGDAHKLAPLSQYYALLAGVKSGSPYDISILPVPKEDFEFQLTAAATIGGRYTLTVTEMDVAFGRPLYLLDRHTGTTVELTGDMSYEFELDAAAAKAIAAKNVVETSVADPLALTGDGLDKSLALTGGEKGTSLTDDQPRFVITSSGPVGSEVAPELPAKFELAQNYPNPFNPATVISYALPEQAQVRLAVYDMLGRTVAVLVDGQQAPGRYDMTWDASNHSSGVYIYRIDAGGLTITRKMTLVK